MTLNQVLDEYCSLRCNTTVNYRNEIIRTVNRFIEWYGSDPDITELKESTVCKFMQHWFDKCQCPTSVNNKRRHLLTLWRYASEEMNLMPMPRKVPKITEMRKIPEAWSLEEMQLIFAAAARQTRWIDGVHASNWWLSFLLCLYWTGSRVGALRQCKVADYDPHKMTLRIQAEYTKTKKEAIYPLPPIVCEILNRFYDTKRVLLWPWNRSPRRLWPAFRRILKFAGIETPKGRRGNNLFHRIRRTAGTLVELAGGDGSKHLGNTREVFERFYFCPGLDHRTWEDIKLPMPELPFVHKSKKPMQPEAAKPAAQPEVKLPHFSSTIVVNY
jgi:integrase